ncbi:MAG: ComEC/Rec2 family competence protein, partial [Clostridia bacterium]|nr:ComEC/Rec2 family competence protein [Clostridia bacterium]
MQIGKARPLCCFFWLICGVIALYVTLSPPFWLLYAGVGVAALVGTVLLITSSYRKPKRYSLLYAAFLSLAILVGFGVSCLHETTAVLPVRKYAEGLEEQIGTLEGTVTGCEVESSYINCYCVNADIEGLGTRRIYLSMTNGQTVSVGDRVLVTGRVLAVEQAEEESWFIRSLRTDGYSLIAYLEEGSEVTVLESGRFVLREWLGGIQRTLYYRLSRAVKLEAGRLTSALLLGTKSELSDQTSLDFRRAGASHLLALSGMHLSLIVLLVDLILRKLRTPYLVRMVTESLLAVLFLSITGCSISTLRATVMLLCLNFSRLRGAPHDAVTPLSVFFGVCLCIRPAWLYDAGLWLTVLATLCVIEIIPALLRHVNERKRSRAFGALWRYLISPLLGSCIVLVVLAIPMALLFGEVSILSPVSNLILGPVTTLLLTIGFFTLPLLYLVKWLPMLSPLTDLLVSVLRWLAETMLNIAAALSDVRGALVSLRYGFAPILIAILLVALLAFLLFRWNRPHRFLYVAAAWCGAFGICLGISALTSLGRWHMTYTASGKSELLMLHEGSAAVVCDMTDGSYSTYRTLLREELPPSVTEIEALVLTHYHNRHITAVYQLLGDIKVRTLWLPMTMPDTDADKAVHDEGLLRSIAAFAKQRRVEVRYYLPHEGAHVLDTLRLERLYFDMISRSTHPTLALSWQHQNKDGESRLFYLGASVWESE